MSWRFEEGSAAWISAPVGKHVESGIHTMDEPSILRRRGLQVGQQKQLCLYPSARFAELLHRSLFYHSTVQTFCVNSCSTACVSCMGENLLDTNNLCSSLASGSISKQKFGWLQFCFQTKH